MVTCTQAHILLKTAILNVPIWTMRNYKLICLISKVFIRSVVSDESHWPLTECIWKQPMHLIRLNDQPFTKPTIKLTAHQIQKNMPHDHLQINVY